MTIPRSSRTIPGRVGFTDANASPEPNDYNEHGGIYLHLNRHGKSFVNFGNGFEFARDRRAGRRGADRRPRARQRADGEGGPRQQRPSVPRRSTPTFPTPRLPEDPTRFNRFDRFKQVFESRYVDRAPRRLQAAAVRRSVLSERPRRRRRDINPNGPDWSFTRFVQDNDAALGLTVELLSNSPCWKDTVIFVVEDDTQNGADHVDGHRSHLPGDQPVGEAPVRQQDAHAACASIFKTVDLILGMPPLNQYDAAATDLRDMFTGNPDVQPLHLPAGRTHDTSARCG